jgi:hypothetical protein
MMKSIEKVVKWRDVEALFMEHYETCPVEYLTSKEIYGHQIGGAQSSSCPSIPQGAGQARRELMGIRH